MLPFRHKRECTYTTYEGPRHSPQNKYSLINIWLDIIHWTISKRDHNGTHTNEPCMHVNNIKPWYHIQQSTACMNIYCACINLNYFLNVWFSKKKSLTKKRGEALLHGLMVRTWALQMPAMMVLEEGKMAELKWREELLVPTENLPENEDRALQTF